MLAPLLQRAPDLTLQEEWLAVLGLVQQQELDKAHQQVPDLVTLPQQEVHPGLDLAQAQEVSKARPGLVRRVLVCIPNYEYLFASSN